MFVHTKAMQSGVRDIRTTLADRGYLRFLAAHLCVVNVKNGRSVRATLVCGARGQRLAVDHVIRFEVMWVYSIVGALCHGLFHLMLQVITFPLMVVVSVPDFTFVLYRWPRLILLAPQPYIPALFEPICII